MKKFRLQSILEYRRSLEEEIQLEFAQSQTLLAREMELSSKIQHQIDIWQQRLQKKQHEAGSIFDSSYPVQIDLLQKFLQFLTAEAKRQAEKVRSLELAADKKRQALLEARQERKVMERLKEKTLALWEREMLQEEQKILDERAISQYRGVLDEEG
ncbi:MAG: flagellar export protein FliJ [bacterium]